MSNDKIEKKLDHIVEEIGTVKVTLASQHEVLAEHVRRTNLLEEEIRPIKKHVHMIEGAIKFIGLVGMIAGIVEAFHWMLK